MKRYKLTPTIRQVGQMMVDGGLNPLDKTNFSAILEINSWAWKFPDGSRVTLDKVELGWAIDVAMELYAEANDAP